MNKCTLISEISQEWMLGDHEATLSWRWIGGHLEASTILIDEGNLKEEMER